MNHRKITLILTILLAVVMLGHAQSQKLAADQFEAKLKVVKEKTVLDVRTQKEFLTGHIPNAVLMDYYQEDFKQQVAKLDKSKPVFVYCAKGGRSNSAAGILVDLGFKQVYDLQGGMEAWKSENKPVTK